jgi:hypothetical protein
MVDIPDTLLIVASPVKFPALSDALLALASTPKVKFCLQRSVVERFIFPGLTVSSCLFRFSAEFMVDPFS